MTVEYEASLEESTDFLEQFVNIDGFDAATAHRRWGDMENANRYVETFIVTSRAEHLRQHERFTRADRETAERVQRYVTSEPKVRHLNPSSPRKLALI